VRPPWISAPNPAEPPPAQVDVAIIGGGIAGCATARFLAEQGARVCILERCDRLGEGSSGRQVGIPWLGLGESPTRIERAMGAECIDILLQLCLQNQQLLQTYCEVSSGTSIRAALDPREPDEFQSCAHIYQRNHIPVTTLSADETNERMGSEGCTGGLAIEAVPWVCGAQIIESFAAQAQRHGASLHLNARVLGVSNDAEGHRIQLATGSLLADVVVFAAGAWLPGIDPWFERKITPVREHVRATRTHDPNHRPPGRAQHGYIQWAHHPAGWFITGGCRWASPHLEVGEQDDTSTSPTIQSAIQRFQKNTLQCPDTPATQWSYLWTKTCDGLPIIGPIPGNAQSVCCTGFMGNDLGLGLRAARAITDGLCTGEAPEIPEWMTPARFV